MTDRATSTPKKKDLLRFDRSDRWALTALLLTWVLVTAWFGVVDPVRRWVGEGPAVVGAEGEVTVPGLDGRGVDVGPGRFDLSVPVDGVGGRLAELAPGLLGTVLLLVGTWLGLQVMRSVASGDPFTPANVTRLRAIAGLLILGTAAVFFLEQLTRSVLLSPLDLGATDVSAWIGVPWPSVVAGMVVALLAEAFKAGSRLRDDVEGLV